MPYILTLIVINSNLTDSSWTPWGINRNKTTWNSGTFPVRKCQNTCTLFCSERQKQITQSKTCSHMWRSFLHTHAAFPHRYQGRWIAAETPTWSRLCCHAAWRIQWVKRPDLEAADHFYRTAWTSSSKKPKTNLKVTTAVPHQNTLSWPVGR